MPGSIIALSQGTESPRTRVETAGGGLLFGSRGAETVLERTAEFPVTIYLTFPPQRLLDTFEPARGGDAEVDALVDRLGDERGVGVGEIDWIHVVSQESPVERLYERLRGTDATIVRPRAGGRIRVVTGRRSDATATVPVSTATMTPLVSTGPG